MSSFRFYHTSLECYLFYVDGVEFALLAGEKTNERDNANKKIRKSKIIFVRKGMLVQKRLSEARGFYKTLKQA